LSAAHEDGNNSHKSSAAEDASHPRLSVQRNICSNAETQGRDQRTADQATYSLCQNEPINSELPSSPKVGFSFCLTLNPIDQIGAEFVQLLQLRNRKYWTIGFVRR
jgi:hypothetical protein